MKPMEPIFPGMDPPIISVPLRESDPDVRIELGEVFLRTYRAGPYRKVLR